MNYSDFVVDKMIFKKITYSSTEGIYAQKKLSENVAVSYEQIEVGNFTSLISGDVMLEVEASVTRGKGTLYAEVYNDNNLIAQGNVEINSEYRRSVHLGVNIIAGKKYIVKTYTSIGTSTTINTEISGYIIDNADEYIFANT